MTNLFSFLSDYFWLKRNRKKNPKYTICEWECEFVSKFIYSSIHNCVVIFTSRFFKFWEWVWVTVCLADWRTEFTEWWLPCTSYKCIVLYCILGNFVVVRYVKTLSWECNILTVTYFPEKLKKKLCSRRQFTYTRQMKLHVDASLMAFQLFDCVILLRQFNEKLRKIYKMCANA